MELVNFSKKKVQIALSNIANGRKAYTPLIRSLFKLTKGVDTTSVELTYDSALGKILPAAERASTNTKTSGNTIGKSSRNAKILKGVHITGFVDIDADEILEVPELTNDKSLVQFNEYMNDEIVALEESFEATREFHALGALKGKVLDSDGTELYDLWKLFDLTKPKPTSVNQANLEQALYLDETLHDLKSKAKKKFKGKIVKGFMMLCGSEAYKAYTFSADVQDSHKNNKLKHVIDGFSDGFNYQNVDFVEYEGGIGETEFIGENDSLFIPIIGGLFKITPTVGVGTQHVNKRGQKTVFTTKILDHDVGVEIKGQSNYVIYVEVPDAISELVYVPTPAVASIIEEDTMPA